MAGSSSNPSGLAQVSGFVLSYKNQILEQIYGGDLLGNVWRFDVSSSDPGAWKVERFADLTSTDGSSQSVTTAPQIEVDFANGVDRYVMIGTGRLLHEDDLVTYGEQVQTMYVFRDGTALKMNTAGLPHKPRTDADFWKLELAKQIDGFSKLPNVRVTTLCDIDENVLAARLGRLEKAAGYKAKGGWGMRNMFPTTIIGYMGNNIYPARAGEVLRAVILKRKEGVAISASLATVIIERILMGLSCLGSSLSTCRSWPS